MTALEKCQQCGSPLTRSEVPFGAGAVCPRCLLGLGLSEQLATEISPRIKPASTGRFRAPDVEQLMGRFPNLEIQHLIGYGGMGAVYQARQIPLDRQVALKILAPTLSNDEAFAQRFMREAKTLAKLSHPNIVMIFEFGKASDFHYLLMEYVDGINLRDAILEGTLSTKDALAIVPQICDALQYAHDEGIVHRDIKPENILIDKKGRVKIADFGLAKLLDPQATDLQLTGTQQVLGTLNYMAPEQIEGRSQVDHRADIYSLGVVFYELLTGELPIGRFPNPSEKSGSPYQLDEVVLRTLEKEPDRRFQTASDVKSAVQLVPFEKQSNANREDNADAMPEIVEAVLAHDLPQKFAKPVDSAQAEKQRKPAAAFNQPFGLGSQVRHLPVEASLPFSIDGLYAGFASAFGILKVVDQQLQIEFEIRDEIMQTIRSKSKVVRIPLEQLASVRLIKGFVSDQIEFQASSLSVTDEIPSSRSGQFTIKTKKTQRETAETLVRVVQANLNPSGSGPFGKNNLVYETSWKEKLVQPFQGLLRWQPSIDDVTPVQVSARFSNIRFWFITCGVLNFVLMSGNIRQQVHRWLLEHFSPSDLIGSSLVNGVLKTLVSIDLAANPFSEKFVNGNGGWTVVMSILMFVTASKLDQLKSFGFVAIVCALLLLPLYPLYIILAPWAFWCLLQLLRPSTIAVFEDCQSCSTDDTNALPQKKTRVPLSGQNFIWKFLCVNTLLLIAGFAGFVLFSTSLSPQVSKPATNKVEAAAESVNEDSNAKENADEKVDKNSETTEEETATEPNSDGSDAKVE